MIPEKLPVYAHRGYSGKKPEGTFEAYDLAVQSGVPQIELDVRTGKDGTVYVIHDDELERLTGVNKNLSELSDDEIRDIRYFNSEAIHTLQEIFDRYKDSVHYLIEIKGGVSDVPALKHLLDKNPLPKANSELMSWDLETARALKKAEPQLNNLLLLEDLKLFQDGLQEEAIDGISMDEAITDADTIAQTHAAGKVFYNWTVNTPARMDELLEQGTDALISNFPDLAKEAMIKAGRI